MSLSAAMIRKSPAAKVRIAGVRETRRPARPAKLKRMYEDDEDSVDVPDTAIGGAKE